jgi:phage terminase large subunit-like protein
MRSFGRLRWFSGMFVAGCKNITKANIAAAIQKSKRLGRSAPTRPEQKPPPGDWRVWMYLAGRGAGKTVLRH